MVGVRISRDSDRLPADSEMPSVNWSVTVQLD